MTQTGPQSATPLQGARVCRPAASESSVHSTDWDEDFPPVYGRVFVSRVWWCETRARCAFLRH
eukprot:6603865-Prymnesium_polylepis.2